MKLIHITTGKTIKVGDCIKNFHGAKWIVKRIHPPINAHDQGMVVVVIGKREGEHLHRPIMFDLKFV